jgi:Flp pilus assembly protein TadG
MTQNNKKRERGQAIIMVTLSMILLFGMLGLVVDLGWGFFVKGSAQSAADAAALAAARKAYGALGQQGNYTCGTDLDCQATAASCSSITNSSNLYSGCQYAQQNFNTRPSSQRNLMMRSGTNSPFATATGNVAVKYWVTATVAGQIPQLFSAVLGQTTLTSSARATAAVVTQVVDGSLILLNRRRDRAVFGNTNYYGVGLMVQANDNGSNYALQTTGNIRIASTCSGTSLGNGDCQAGNKPSYAGMNQGGGTVYAPSTRFLTAATGPKHPRMAPPRSMIP